MNTRRDYYDNEREIGWEKFDDGIVSLSINLIDNQFGEAESIPGGLKFGGAYVFKIVDDETDNRYLDEGEESTAVLEYDKSDPGYDEEFVEKFAETFSASEEERREKIEENFDVLLRE